jgi:citrate synthase/2-methylcitrate synthase
MVAVEIKKGLAGVVVDYTAISKVNPDTNSLLYRGYPVQELAAKCSFEEVAFLLWNGELPTPEELAEFSARERAGRALDPVVKHVIDALPTTAHPMDVCRTAASVLGARHALAEVSTPEANMAKAVDLFAAMPAVVAYDQRRRRAEGRPVEPVEPRDDLGYSANFLWMTFGEDPVEEVVKAFNVSMILYAEHSFNASTFTARVVTSTLSDLHSAVTAAIGALKGPLHGGANEAVMHTFEEIGIRTEESLEDAAARAKTWVPTMKAALDKMIAHYGRPEILGLYSGLEQAMDEAKAIKPNLDYPTGPTYHLMGFDTQTFTPLFVASRITGWTAHIMEQLASNSLIRPLSAYNGVDERHLA